MITCHTVLCELYLKYWTNIHLFYYIVTECQCPWVVYQLSYLQYHLSNVDLYRKRVSVFIVRVLQNSHCFNQNDEKFKSYYLLRHLFKEISDECLF